MNTSAFISYRSIDGVDFPFHLTNYLKEKSIDTFCDQKDPANQTAIIDKLIFEVSKRDNFVIIFTKKSIEYLIDYRKNGGEDRDYVNEELEAAIKYHCNIIPVFIEADNSWGELSNLCRELFIESFNFNDTYHTVYRDQRMPDRDFLQKILQCMSDRVFVAHTDISELYWVGNRMSDISGVGCFKGYVLFFGDHSCENTYVMCSSNSNQRVDHNDASDIEQDLFIEDSVRKILKKDSNAKFMFYNPSTVYRLNFDQKFGIEHFVCLNDRDILERVNNKRSFRTLIKGMVPLLPVIERTRTDCDYDDLFEAKQDGAFIDQNDYGERVPDIQYDTDLQFIVQAPVSSGGSGTFILNQRNARYLLSSLDPYAKYLVSIYHTRNISVNIHVLVDSNSVICLPASIQLEREVSVENKLLYKGADFIAYNQIDYMLRIQFEAQAEKVARKLQSLGYRGVLGIDAILHDGRANILEVNGRFQASTELINRELLRHGFKTLQELNFEAFSEKGISEIDADHCRSIRVPFSNFAFSYEGQTMHDKRVFRRACELIENSEKTVVADIQADGYNPEQTIPYNAQAYLYRIVFNKNIASISEDGAVLINENICEPEKWLTKKILAKEKLAVKVALMIQGINVEKEIKESLREATNNAVDLQFGDGQDVMIINAPTNIRYVEFSPFDLKRSIKYRGKFCVCYYNKELIDNVGVFPADMNQDMMLKDGRHAYSEIAYLSTDRLRVHLTNACMYKLSGNGCKFCNISIDPNPNLISSEDIKEVVEKYMKDKKETTDNLVTLRHFLIGGQSLENGDSQIVCAAKVLSKYHMPIYVMTLPLKEETVEKLVSYGVFEFAYNIEIFNDRCRKKYMPGKGQTSFKEYLAALRLTREVLNAVKAPKERKVVRSMVIVGLEPYADMMNGIQELIKNDIEPILSVFRPLPDTPLENLNAPSIKMVYELFYTVSALLYEESIGKDRNADKRSSTKFHKLGPKCPCCQNNTVSLPWDIQVGKEVRMEWSVDQTKANF